MHSIIYLVAVVLFGAFAGWITSKMMHVKTEFWGNALIGTVGAFIGSVIMTLIGGAGFTGFNLYSLLVSIGGACLFTWLVRQLDDKKRSIR